MNTVFNFLTAYCEERNLPPPDNKDLHYCGKMINHSFRNFIYNLVLPPGTIIENAGLLVQEEHGKRLLVLYYPEEFKEEMTARCDYHFSVKDKPKEPLPPAPANGSEPPPQKKRKRKPITTTIPVKAFSIKPSNTVGQPEGQ